MKKVVCDAPHVLLERKRVCKANVPGLGGFGHGFVAERPSLLARPHLRLRMFPALIQRDPQQFVQLLALESEQKSDAMA
jgi:hypothetical protein